MKRLLVILIGWAVLNQPARAGVYHPDLLAAFDLDEQGFAIPDSLDEFMKKVGTVRKMDDPKSDESRELLRSIRDRERKGLGNLPPEQQASLIADMLRLRRDEAVLNRTLEQLNLLSRRPPEGVGFLLRVEAAYLQSLLGNFANAVTIQDSAFADLGREQPFPPGFAGLTAKQRAWYESLEREAVFSLLRFWAMEAERKGTTNRAHFDVAYPRMHNRKLEPVRFVGETGRFEVGAIAATEAAKLPPDVVAIVQQLILWYPDDGWLWWLLAEVYNARGDLAAASRVYDLCTRELRFTNPELLEHRRTVMQELDVRQRADEDRKRKEQEERQRVEQERQRKTIMLLTGGVGIIIAFVVYSQARAWRRRARKRQAQFHPDVV